MRHIATLAILAVTALATTACGVTVSANRLYGGNDLAADVNIEGRWTDDDGSEVWEFNKEGDSYLAVQVGKDEGEALSIHIVTIGHSRFLDVAPAKTPLLAIETHFILKMHFEGEELVVECPDWDWLHDYAVHEGLTQVDLDGSHLLTSPTPDLQRFFSMYADDARAWDTDALRIHRVP